MREGFVKLVKIRAGRVSALTTPLLAVFGAATLLPLNVNLALASQSAMRAQTTVEGVNPLQDAINAAQAKAQTKAQEKARQNAILPGSYIDPDELAGGVTNLTILGPDSPARQALDAVGGKEVRLGAADEVCSWDQAIACSYSSTNIVLILNTLKNNSYDYWYPVMMHEYAHQVQAKYQDRLDHSDGYNELFHADPEWLADCMAASRIPTYVSGYGFTCTPEQKAFGKNAWEGNV